MVTDSVDTDVVVRMCVGTVAGTGVGTNRSAVDIDSTWDVNMVLVVDNTVVAAGVLIVAVLTFLVVTTFSFVRPRHSYTTQNQLTIIMVWIEICSEKKIDLYCRHITPSKRQKTEDKLG